jgi:hypothetical protein
MRKSARRKKPLFKCDRPATPPRHATHVLTNTFADDSIKLTGTLSGDAGPVNIKVMSQESLDIPTEWWLDWSGLPDRLIWARLQRLGDHVAVLDCDGITHRFDSYDEARLWLNEDEYSRMEHLVEDGELPTSTVPPMAVSDADLVRLMLVAVRPGMGKR